MSINKKMVNEITILITVVEKPFKMKQSVSFRPVMLSCFRCPYTRFFIKLLFLNRFAHQTVTNNKNNPPAIVKRL